MDNSQKIQFLREKYLKTMHVVNCKYGTNHEFYFYLKNVEDVLLGHNQDVTAETLEAIEIKLKKLFPDSQFYPEKIINLDSDDDENENMVVISDSDDDGKLDKEVEEILKHTSSIKVEQDEEVNNKLKNLNLMFPKPTENPQITLEELAMLSSDQSPKKNIKTPAKVATTPKRPQKPLESIAAYRIKKTIMPPASAYVKPSSNKRANYLTVPYKENQGPQQRQMIINQKELDQKLKLFKESFFLRKCADVQKAKQIESPSETCKKNSELRLEVVKAAAPVKPRKTKMSDEQTLDNKKRRLSCCAETKKSKKQEVEVPKTYNLRLRSKSLFPSSARNNSNPKKFHHMVKDLKKNEPVVKIERLRRQTITFCNAKRPASQREEDIDWNSDQNKSMELLDVLSEKKKF